MIPILIIRFMFFFFFKQKTAYEITTGDWSSDVCSSDLTPSSTSTRNSTTSLAATAASTWVRMARLSWSCAPGTIPPVSTSQNRRPFHSAAPKCRSRVTPGLASTIASRPPMSRLNSVDLPTLGRPMMATVGCPSSLPHPERGTRKWERGTRGKGTCSAFRVPRSEFTQDVRKVIRQVQGKGYSRRELVGADVVYEHQVVVHGLGWQQDEVQVRPSREGPLDRRRRQQPRRRHRAAEQRVLDHDQLEAASGGGRGIGEHLRHERPHRSPRHHADPPARPVGEPIERRHNARLEITHRAHAVLALIELTIPCCLRERLSCLEVEIVRAIAPRPAPLHE